jgi:NTE family protein
VSGVDRSTAEKIEDQFADNVGKPMDLNRLEKDIDVISGVGRYTRFSYRTTERNGQSGLQIQAEEKDYAPPLLNIGMLIDGSDLNGVQWTMSARITALDVGGFRSEWRTDLSIGSTWGLATEYYHPITATSKWFIAPRAFGTSIPFDLYDRTKQLAEYRIRHYGVGLDGGYAINRFSELRFGYEGGYLDPSLKIGSAVLPEPTGRTGISSIQYNLDRLDSPVVPRSGEIVSLRSAWVDASPGASTGFPLANAYFGVFRRVGRRSTAYVQGYGGTTFGHNNTGVPQFFLGGPGQLNSYGKNELRTDQYWLGRVGYLYELFSLPPLIGRKTYFTSSYEVAHAYQAPGASHLPNDGSVGLLVETLFGPLFVGGSYGDSGHHKIYFSLGRLF